MRGRHRILLGMAAGVGKSYRMLLEGRQALADGVDVVIGYLEPHDRPETAALADGLEVIPRRIVDHGGVRLGEMDVEALLRRTPQLVLVDELAHTNAPESAHSKRYQDIEQILAAGIDVVSTVNVQHLESLNDVVYELTGVRVRETFPDSVLDTADQVVLVDLTPEELRLRLEAGRIYPGHQVERALQHFFRTENLAALRELALREVAEDVEARRHPNAFDPDAELPLADRLLVLVTPQAQAQRLVRRAWRSAQRLGANMDVLFVRRPGHSLSDDETQHLRGLRRLTMLLGAHFLEEEGDDLVPTVRRVAADRGSTYVFLGTPDTRRVEEIRRGSLLMRLLRELPGIDVRVVADPQRREELG